MYKAHQWPLESQNFTVWSSYAAAQTITVLNQTYLTKMPFLTINSRKHIFPTPIHGKSILESICPRVSTCIPRHWKKKGKNQKTLTRSWLGAHWRSVGGLEKSSIKEMIPIPPFMKATIFSPTTRSPSRPNHAGYWTADCTVKLKFTNAFTWPQEMTPNQDSQCSSTMEIILAIHSSICSC